MNRQAFRNRMQLLKLYRELNPDKTYLDFKKYADGGEVPPENPPLGTYDLNLGKRTITNRLTTNFLEERDWLSNFAKERAKRPEFADLLDNDLLTKYLYRVNNAPIRVTDGAGLPQQAVGVTKYDTSVNIPYEDKENFYKTGAGVIVKEDPAYGNNTSYSRDLNSNVIHELDHTTLISTGAATGKRTGFSKRVLKVADIMGTDLNKEPGMYGARPWEVLSRRLLMFHEMNADPNTIYDKKDIKSIKGYLKKYDLDFLGEDKVIKLLNDVASNDLVNPNTDEIFHAAEGGEIPPSNKPIIPEKPQPYKGKLYKDRYGRKYTEDQVSEYYDSSTDEIDRFTGQPFVRGLKPVGDIEDAANMTPIGDAISAYDTYLAVKNKDWEGAGLAAMGLIPFMPMTVKQFRSKYKGVTPKLKYKPKSYGFNTSVNKNYVLDRINESIAHDAAINAKLSEAANLTYNVAERLMDDPSYINRANLVKKQFGDDYTKVYADIIDSYNNDPFSLPNIEKFSDGKSRARMLLNKNRTYSYKLDPDLADLSVPVTEHELSHYADFKRNANRPDAHGDSNMFYQMQKDISDKKIDNRDSYYSLPTEQKAHMNLLREYMFQNNYISNRGETVSDKLLKKVLEETDKLDSMKGVARASKLFKSFNKYTKWFNSIPLLGLGAAAMYKGKDE